MSSANPVFSRLPTTIFTHMSALATEHRAINLGQGFPDTDGPAAIREAAARSLIDGPNQYPPMRGLPVLRQAIAAHARTHYGLDYSVDDEVVVTSGGTEALTSAILAMVKPGDEVLLIEPAYDSYRPIAEAAGATVRSLVLQPPHWRLDAAALVAAITPRTRLVMFNSPLNPVGRVFKREEIAALARAVIAADAVVVADEVYEHLSYDGRPHIPIATMPGMRERTLRVGSAGKIFSLTGWKVGWVTGPRALVDVVAKTHQFLTFTTPPALQIGIAHGLTHELGFADALRAKLQGNRDVLAAGLAELGFAVLPSEGTYFLCAGIEGLTDQKDLAFCETLTREAGVTAIPLSAFFREDKPDTYIRFAFCKERSLVEEALERLTRYFGGAR